MDHLGPGGPPGSFFGLVGPNGAGKTTALSMAVGLLVPDAGIARVLGVEVWADPVAAKRLLGVLPDNLALPERLTGRELLTYLGLLRGLDRATVAAGGPASCWRCWSSPRPERTLVADYSAGMRKKITLATALLHTPRLLVLDEPFEAIDPVSAATIRAILRRFVDAGGSVVISSHVMALVEQLCDHVAVMAEGRLVAAGTLDQVRGGGSLDDAFGAAGRRPHQRRRPGVAGGPDARAVGRRRPRHRRRPDRPAPDACPHAPGGSGTVGLFRTLGLALAVGSSCAAWSGLDDPDRWVDLLGRAVPGLDDRLGHGAGRGPGRRPEPRPSGSRCCPPRRPGHGGCWPPLRRGSRRPSPWSPSGPCRSPGPASGSCRCLVARAGRVGELVLVVVLSRVVVAAPTVTLSSRRGQELGGLLMAVVIALASGGWSLAAVVGQQLAEDRGPALSTALRALPSG